MEKMRVHTPSEYVPKSLIEMEKKINEVIDKLNELTKRVEKLEPKEKEVVDGVGI